MIRKYAEGNLNSGTRNYIEISLPLNYALRIETKPRKKADRIASRLVMGTLAGVVGLTALVTYASPRDNADTTRPSQTTSIEETE